MKKHTANEKGNVLVMVLMITMVLMLLVTVMLSMTSNSITQMETMKKNDKAYFLARSGADSVREAWDSLSKTGTQPISVSTIYVDKTVLDSMMVSGATANLFTLTDPGSANNGGTLNVRYFEVDANGNQTPTHTNRWKIESTAVVEGNTRTVSMTSGVFNNANQSSTQYFDSSGRLLPGANTAYTTPQYFSELDRTYSVVYSWHPEVFGTVVLDPPGTSTTLRFINEGAGEFVGTTRDEGSDDKNKISIIAKNIVIKNNLNLSMNEYDWSWSWLFDHCRSQQGVLSLSAERIVFPAGVNLNISSNLWDPTLIWGDRGKMLREADYLGPSFGILNMHVPDGYGIPGEEARKDVSATDRERIDVNQTYGKIYFSTVTFGGSSAGSFSPAINSNAYYFLKTDQGVPLGSRIKIDASQEDSIGLFEVQNWYWNSYYQSGSNNDMWDDLTQIRHTVLINGVAVANQCLMIPAVSTTVPSDTSDPEWTWDN